MLRTRPGRRGVFAALLALAVVVAACGDDDDSTAPTTAGAAVTTGEGATTAAAATSPAPTTGAPATSAPAASAATSTRSASKQDTLKLVTVASLTGPNQANGTPLARGIELAADDINATGGIVAGDTAYTLQVSTEDAAGDPNQAVAITKQAISDGADVVVAASTSPETIPMSEIVLANPDILMLSPSSAVLAAQRAADPASYPNVISNQVVADKFRACYVPEYMKLADAKSIGIIMTDNVTGQSIAKNLPALVEAQGGTVVASELYAPDTTDFAPILTKVKNANPDLIIVGYLPGPVSSLLKQARDLGIKNLAGVEGIYPTSVEKALGSKLEGFMWLHNLPPLPAEGKLAEVWGEWKTKYGDDPAASPDQNALVYLGYDAVVGFQHAAEKAGTIDPKAVVEGFRNLDYSGILNWSYDQKESADVDIRIGRWENGQNVYYDCPK